MRKVCLSDLSNGELCEIIQDAGHVSLFDFINQLEATSGQPGIKSMIRNTLVEIIREDDLDVVEED